MTFSGTIHQVHLAMGQNNMELLRQFQSSDIFLEQNSKGKKAHSGSFLKLVPGLLSQYKLSAIQLSKEQFLY